MNRITAILCFIAFILTSCGEKSEEPVIAYYEEDDEPSEEVVVPYREVAGIKYIAVKINGVSMDMIFDTGCSGISLSLNEAIILAKNDAINNDDIIGTERYTIADGNICEGAVVRLHSVSIKGNEKNEIEVPNVNATIIDNIEAPALLGNGVLDETYSYTIDNISKTITFRKK